MGAAWGGGEEGVIGGEGFGVEGDFGRWDARVGFW